MTKVFRAAGVLWALAAVGGAVLAAPDPAPAPETWVTSVASDPHKAGGAVLRIEATASVRFTTFRLAETEGKPERLVVDIQDARWKQGYAEAHVGAGGVIGWRASLFADKPPVTRVVVELLGGTTFRTATASPAQSIRIEIGSIDPPGETPGGTDPGGPSQGGAPEGPSTPENPPTPPEARPEQKLHLTKVEVIESDAEHLDLRLILDGPGDPIAFLFADPALFVLDIPYAAPAATKGVASGWVDLDRGACLSVRRIRLCEMREGAGLSSRLVVDLASPTPYDLTPDSAVPNAWRLSLRFSAGYQGLVVLDPGHGGAEAGSRGVGGIAEEDVNLQLTLRLRAELMRRGIAAILTRTADTTSNLYQRPYIGNELGADLFLSIHCNIGSPREGGTETYYYHESGKPLATAVQNALVKALGRPDRGVRRGDYAVTRDSAIPAALTEVVFMDCPEEARLVTQEAFQNRVAVAIAGAIEETLRAQRAARAPAQP